MAGLFRHSSGQYVRAYRVKNNSKNKDLKEGDWIILDNNGHTSSKIKNEKFLSSFVPSDKEAEKIYLDAAFEKSLPGG